MPFIRIRLNAANKGDEKKNLGLAKVKVAEPTKDIWEHKLILTGGNPIKRFIFLGRNCEFVSGYVHIDF